MRTNWTFGRSLGVGFALVLLLNVIGGAVALFGLNEVVRAKDRVIEVDSRLELIAQKMISARAERAADARAYLLTGDTDFRQDAENGTDRFEALLREAGGVVHTDRGRSLLATIRSVEQTVVEVQADLFEVRANGTTLESAQAFVGARNTRVALQKALTDFADYEEALTEEGIRAAESAQRRDIITIVVVIAGAVLATALIGLFITRRMRRRIGTAVGDVQASSAELQTTANQQAVGAMEQATAMSEISTTINELLATSRQITESAQRVSDVAEQTAEAGGSGRSTLATAQQSMDEISGQVDVIVGHMLELGEKSQQIGAVLGIVSELAEQTNILAINSTIEAAGAGESGRRFGVVADEIRKLADRVAESTKEIRTLIDEVRGAVHTTVLATEIGKKSVDAGTAQFESVAAQFEQIVDLVQTTTEAAREIELSTKQQTSAVEQVNFAVGNVTQTTRDNEAGSAQTLVTASQLAELSSRLRMLIEPGTLAHPELVGAAAGRSHASSGSPGSSGSHRSPGSHSSSGSQGFSGSHGLLGPPDRDDLGDLNSRDDRDDRDEPPDRTADR
ncbi:methyl-accepting chemotaxis protein [Kineosporia sp. J2-2]|uniref:Methyl-accepting chemotaxis protein n=1 Tax=Kineosporia corallincola TaxID=2835133 RepID=A0ABS5TS48_9ACTN|nr:methyl-accepting chemotaxis protein [Kineosporia corallincola]MBT0773615.1 methyl-accepting chemotaxis protein [Kineosporia corallincola]